MGYHEDCPQCGNQLPDGVSTNDGLCTDCWQESYNKLEGQYWELASKNTDLKAEVEKLKADVKDRTLAVDWHKGTIEKQQVDLTASEQRVRGLGRELAIRTTQLDRSLAQSDRYAELLESLQAMVEAALTDTDEPKANRPPGHPWDEPLSSTEGGK